MGWLLISIVSMFSSFTFSFLHFNYDAVQAREFCKEVLYQNVKKSSFRVIESFLRSDLRNISSARLFQEFSRRTDYITRHIQSKAK